MTDAMTDVTADATTDAAADVAVDAALTEEFETLRQRYRDLGRTTVEVVSALDAVLKRGDALGSVGPGDRVWYRAKTAVARAVGMEAEPRPPATPLWAARRQLQEAPDQAVPEALRIVNQMEQLQSGLDQVVHRLSNFPPHQWSPWLDNLLVGLEDEADAHEFEAFLRELSAAIDRRLAALDEDLER